jgi:hypothetical protein
MLVQCGCCSLPEGEGHSQFTHTFHTFTQFGAVGLGENLLFGRSVSCTELALLLLML